MGAIMDTESAGVVISESCFEILGLVVNDKVEYTITSATNTNKNIGKFFWSRNCSWKKQEEFSALVLERLHFDMLLGMSWI